MVRSGVLLLVVSLVCACGDEAREAPPRPPGTYVLDVDHWLESATAMAAGSRLADRTNQATGADPLLDSDAPEGSDRPRPSRPTPLEEMTLSEREAFEEHARSYIAEEAKALRETLTLSPDGRYHLEHASRAAEGGSIMLGLVRGVTVRGTWTLDDDVLTLRSEESERPDGTTWPIRSAWRGTVQQDGTIRMEGAPRQWRDQESLYRPQSSD